MMEAASWVMSASGFLCVLLPAAQALCGGACRRMGPCTGAPTRRIARWGRQWRATACWPRKGTRHARSPASWLKMPYRFTSVRWGAKAHNRMLAVCANHASAPALLPVYAASQRLSALGPVTAAQLQAGCGGAKYFPANESPPSKAVPQHQNVLGPQWRAAAGPLQLDIAHFLPRARLFVCSSVVLSQGVPLNAWFKHTRPGMSCSVASL